MEKQKRAFFRKMEKHRLSMDFENFEVSSPVNFIVLDMLGRSRESHLVMGGRIFKLDLENYPRGQYIIKAEVEQQVFYFKFMKE